MDFPSLRPNKVIGPFARNMLVRELLIALLFLAIGIAFILRPLAFGNKLPGDLVDGRINLALLEYLWRCVENVLHGRSADFLNLPIFYPWPRATNFTDTYWGQGAFYLLARGAGANPYQALQFWFNMGFVLVYASSFWCLRRFGLSPLGAATGAFLFTFALPVTVQTMHPNLLYRLWVPPAMLTAHRFLMRGRLTDAAACMLFLSLQLAVNIYLGLLLFLLLACLVIAIILARRAGFVSPILSGLRALTFREATGAAVLFALAAALLLVVAIPYIEVERLYGFRRSWQTVSSGLPRPQSYLLTSRSEIWPYLYTIIPAPNLAEQNLFPGLPALISVGWFACSAAARCRRPLAGQMLLCLVLLTGLTVCLGGLTLFYPLYFVPGFEALRAASRVILLSLFPLGALLGLMLDDFMAAEANRLLMRAAAAVTVAFLVVEACAIKSDASDIAAWQAREAVFAAALPRALPPNAILVAAAPPAERAGIYTWEAAQMDAEWLAVKLGIRTLNGYSGNFPPTWAGPAQCRDIAPVFRAGARFLAEHNLKAAPVRPGQLVLTGFGDCPRDQVLHLPVLQLGARYDFGRDGNGNAMAGGGFSPPEEGSRWTDGNDAYLDFSVSDVPAGEIIIA
ncbi:MAG: hypothetical protein JO256_06285, partial [Alphaproteobacteria bacterium]|nr:hypothetical protein [Alphaproteobacteria bacterium]